MGPFRPSGRPMPARTIPMGRPTGRSFFLSSSSGPSPPDARGTAICRDRRPAAARPVPCGEPTALPSSGPRAGWETNPQVCGGIRRKTARQMNCRAVCGGMGCGKRVERLERCKRGLYSRNGLLFPFLPHGGQPAPEGAEQAAHPPPGSPDAAAGTGLATPVGHQEDGGDQE